jgi:hypothetical protein
MISNALQSIRKTFFRNSESDSEVVWHSKAITRCKECPPFSDSTTEFSRTAAAL